MSYQPNATKNAHKMAVLVVCHKCNRSVDVKQTALCSVCKNNFEPDCDGYPAQTYRLKSPESKRKWRCTSCTKKTVASGDNNVTIRKKNLLLSKTHTSNENRSGSPVHDLHKLTNSTPSRAAHETPWSTPKSSISDQHELSMDDTHNNSLSVIEQTLSRSMDHTILNAIGIREIDESMQELRSELASTQNELEHVILENNDLRSQINKLTKENGTLKMFLCHSPNCKNKKKTGTQNILTPSRSGAVHLAQTESTKTINDVAHMQKSIEDLEQQLDGAKSEISGLNKQIRELQQALQIKKTTDSLPRHSSMDDSRFPTNPTTNGNRGKNKLCILTNMSSSNTLSAVEDIFGSQFYYCRYVFPNMNVLQLLNNLNNKIVNFNMNDYCVVMLGGNGFSMSCNYKEMVNVIKKSLEHVTHTNIIVCAPTYICGAPIYNYKIELFNNLLLKCLENNNHATYFDSNSYLTLDMFSQSTGKLNKKGLINLYKVIMKHIKKNLFNFCRNAATHSERNKFFLGQ